MRRIGIGAVLTVVIALLVPATALAGNEAAPWSAPDYISQAGETAEGPSLGMLAGGSLVATWTEYDTDKDGWFPELASEPFAGTWSSQDALSSTAISQPLDTIGGVRTAVDADGKYVSAWLAPSSTSGYYDVDGASGSVDPGGAVSVAPQAFATYSASGAYKYGYLSPEVEMSSNGTGTVEYTAASQTQSGGTYVGFTPIDGGSPGASEPINAAHDEYDPGSYSGDNSQYAPELGSPAPLNSDWDASVSDEQTLVAPALSSDGLEAYATDDPADWTDVTAAAPSDSSGLAASAAVLADGKVLVASGWYGLDIWETGDASATQISDAAPPGSTVLGRPAIATYNDGSATIAYLVEDNDTGYYTVEEITIAPDGDVSAPVALSPAGIDVSKLTDAYGPDGTTYVVWSSTDPNDSANDGIYASIRLPGAVFPSTPQTVVAGSAADQDPEIAIDQTGYATIVAEVLDASGDGGDRIAAFTHANPLPPRLNTAPVITPAGTPTVGTTLSCSKGTWYNRPTVYTFAWLRNGSPIGGATSSTYTVTSADAGQELSCRVTATNAYGSGLGTSATVKPSSKTTTTTVTPGKVTTQNSTVSVSLSCSGSSACASVTITLSVVEEPSGKLAAGVMARADTSLATKKKKAKTVVIASKTVKLRAGQHKTVKLTLNRKGRALLRSHPKLPAKLALKSGKKTLKTEKLKLKAAKHKKK